MENTLSDLLPVKTGFEESIVRLFRKELSITGVFLAQRTKKKVKALFEQIIIHLARLLGKIVAGRPPDHQEDTDPNRSHWWKEIKNFVQQIKDERLSEAQLRRILEDAFSSENVEIVLEALREAAEMMEDSPPNLF